MQQITTFLMFEGRAKEAIDLYTSVFENSGITNISYYGPNEAGAEGSVKHAVFMLNGQEFMCIDSFVKHGFTFTASMSLSVKCRTDEEIDTIYEKLSEGGQVMMTLGAYPFSRKFAWIADKFGVSWQFNLV